MAKRLLILFFSLLGLLLLSFFTAYFSRTLILSSLLSSKMGTKVRMEELLLSPPLLGLESITVANLPGYKNPHALTIGSAVIDAPYSAYFRRVIHIDRVSLDNSVLTVEFTGPSKKSTNWNALMAELARQKKLSPSRWEGRHSIIKLLVINNLKIRVFVGKTLLKEKIIPRLTFKNLNTDKGEISRRLTQVILFQIFLNMQDMINMPLETANDSMSGFFNLFKSS